MAIKGKSNGVSSNGKGKMDFAPADFDVNSMPPSIPAAEWTAKCVKALVKPTKKGWPMIELTWKFTAVEGGGKTTKKFIGKTQKSWLVFPPKGVDGERMMKLNIRSFCSNFDIDLSVLPTGKLTSKGAFDDFLAELKGLEGTIWTEIQENDEGGDSRIVYKAPKAGGTAEADEEEEADDEDSEEDEDEDEKPAKAKKGAKKAPVDEEEEDEDSEEDEDDLDEEDEDDEEDEEEEVAAKSKKKVAAKGRSARA